MKSTSRRRGGVAAVLLFCLLTQFGYQCEAASGQAQPGKAGYALVFHDSVIVKKDFTNFPTKQMTFEAWVSTTDFCHSGAVMSYALPSESNDISELTKAANHFVIFDVKNVIACHDFEFIDIIPDYLHMSCHGHYNRSATDFDPETGKLVDREGNWRHLAVTWDSESDGETKVYIDGSLAGYAKTGRSNEIEAGGAFMLGGEQDCFGGCTDPKQGFYGLMDEVRIWDVVRSQEEIVSTMRNTGDLPSKEHLVAYWKFDDPGTDGYEQSGIVADSSGHGNDLDVLVPPIQSTVVIEKNGRRLETGALTFKNNYAMNPNIKGVPKKDITIEFWARSGPITSHALTNEDHAEFLSFAAVRPGDGNTDNDGIYADLSMIDDAIRIERYLMEYNETQYLRNSKTNTLGSISVHVNSNRQGNGRQNDNWIDFATEWVDDDWHHLAVTWKFSTGGVHLYFDGESVKPFWRAEKGRIHDEDPVNGGVSNKISPKSARTDVGSLVLGQNQECYGGCFSPSTAFDGSLANVRIWSRVLSPSEIKQFMFENYPSRSDGLVMNFMFTEDNIKGKHERNRRIVNTEDKKVYLEMGSLAPSFQFSTVPLSDADGVPLPTATPGYMGYALELSDKQLLMLRNFHDFPSDAITVEFWMFSTDACREGVPFSYAHGEYQANDNAFLIFNYNNWGISVMEDEGKLDDHNAGFGSTDGKWHHIAVTWDSKSGTATLYDNSIPQWRVSRAKGLTIPAGGTLVIGREQDCLGGCFDSAPGAAGDVQEVTNLEYGPQDFYGLIEEVRIWKRVRSRGEIYAGMVHDKDIGSGKENADISSRDPDLVAWWKFDEGAGYTVKDETGHGNTLRILSEPKWVVPRWVETCGDGLLDATEGCDDGNRKDGDGCSSECLIEDGYSCTTTSPSACYASEGRQGRHKGGQRKNNPSVVQSAMSHPPKERSIDHDTMPSGTVYVNSAMEDSSTISAEATGGKKHRSGVATFFIVVLVFAIIGFILFIVYRKRETIYEHVPGLRTVVNNAQDQFSAAFGRSYHRYDLAAVDPEEAYVSPGFVDSQPPAANRASGGNVPYEPIGDATSRPTN